MTHRRFTGMAIILLAQASAVAEPGSTETGAFIRVVCDFDNDLIAAQALKTAEMAWPLAAKMVSVSDSAPTEPAEIHLLRTIEAYERVDAELNDGRLRNNLAFAHPETRAAYIVVQPNCDDVTLSRVGLPALTRRLIAHEVTHLVRYTKLPNHRSHPAWLTDGVATCVAADVMCNGGWSAAVADDPDMSTYVLEVRTLLVNDRLPLVKDILRDRMDDIDWRTRYSVRWLLVRFLQVTQGAPVFEAIMGKARQLGGGSTYTERLVEFVEKSLGPNEMNTIDAEFKSYLRGLEPQWDEVFRSLETAGRSWTQIAFPDTNAIAWRTTPVGRDAYTLEGRFKILPGQKRQLNLLLGRNEDGFVSVAFTGSGDVTIFHYHAKENRWQRLANMETREKALDRWVRFRAEVTGGQLRITLNQKHSGEASLNGRSMRGPWGLGAQNGSAGMWKNVRLR